MYICHWRIYDDDEELFTASLSLFTCYFPTKMTSCNNGLVCAKSTWVPRIKQKRKKSWSGKQILSSPSSSIFSSCVHTFIMPTLSSSSFQRIEWYKMLSYFVCICLYGIYTTILYYKAMILLLLFHDFVGGGGGGGAAKSTQREKSIPLPSSWFP